MKAITELELELEMANRKVDLFKKSFIATHQKLKEKELYIEECDECIESLNELVNDLTALVIERGGF